MVGITGKGLRLGKGKSVRVGKREEGFMGGENGREELRVGIRGKG